MHAGDRHVYAKVGCAGGFECWVWASRERCGRPRRQGPHRQTGGAGQRKGHKEGEEWAAGAGGGMGAVMAWWRGKGAPQKASARHLIEVASRPTAHELGGRGHGAPRHGGQARRTATWGGLGTKWGSCPGKGSSRFPKTHLAKRIGVWECCCLHSHARCPKFGDRRVCGAGMAEGRALTQPTRKGPQGRGQQGATKARAWVGCFQRRGLHIKLKRPRRPMD